VPQLWQKWHTMMAHTGLLLRIFRHGTFSAAPRSMVLAVMYERSLAVMNLSSLGLEEANLDHMANHTEPSEPKMKNTEGHEKLAMSVGEMASPAMEPEYMPEYTSASERERSCIGTHLPPGQCREKLSERRGDGESGATTVASHDAAPPLTWATH
jgi:hypothetical protein